MKISLKKRVIRKYNNKMTDTTNTEPEFTQEQVKQVLDTMVSMKVSMIRQMANLIEVCNKRGAFQASELEGVGSMFKALTGAIEDAGKRVKEASEKLETVPEEPKTE